MRYSNGEIVLIETDLSFKSFGLEWGHTRSYGNLVTQPGEGRNGNSWFVKEWPHLVPVVENPLDPNQPLTVTLVWIINQTLWFDFDANLNRYVARFYLRPTLRHDAENKQWTLTDSEGRVTKFFDFDAEHPEELRGQFKSITDAAGRETVAEYDPASHLLRSLVQQAGEVTSGFDYIYYLTGSQTGRLQYVTYRVEGRRVRQVRFTYYGANEKHGSLGDLKKAVVRQWSGSAWVDLATRYYRYYKEGNPDGVAHGIRFVLSPQGYRKMMEQGITPEIATNGQLADFAKHEFRYEAGRGVREEVVNSGTTAYRFARTTSATVPPADDFNIWRGKAVEDLPDGNRRIIYTNFAGQAMLSVFIWMNGPLETNRRWYAYQQYDGMGRTVLVANSSAVAGCDESIPTLVILRPGSGLIQRWEYYTSGDLGGAPGRQRFEMVQKGSAGTPVKIREWQYLARTIGQTTVYKVSAEIAYQSAIGGGSDPAVTSYDYTWEHFQAIQKTTLLPVVEVDQNGSGVADQTVNAYDLFGRLRWRKDERGYITGFSYDIVTDAMVQRVQDVAEGAPWPVLPGAHLNLVTDYTVDDEGRTTQELGPAHGIDIDGAAMQVRRARWTVYQDAICQQWQGTGFQRVSDSTVTLINPVNLRLYDEAGRLRDEIVATRATATGPLRSSDSFPQSSWARWTRNLYEGMANVAAQRVYFAIPSEGEGERDVHYNQSEFGYDILHRKVRDHSPGGTVTRYVHHPQGWILQKWVGTNDTGANDINPTGNGAVGNNMVIVESYDYDGSKSQGDGNLTKLIRYVTSTEKRVTTYKYDWRNRRTSTDGEIDFWEGYTVNNLDQITRTDRRNTTTGGTLIGRSEALTDSLRRVYRQLHYGVNPATGIVSAPLTANSWFDSAGNAIKQQAKGSRAVTKTEYDSLNRPVRRYLTCDSSQGEPSSVTGDIVVEQMECNYDEAGNPTYYVLRKRFHDASGTGALTSPTGFQPKARVSYTVLWPDALGRLATLGDYGTNGGQPLTRPIVAPSRSDTVLITSIAFNERGEAWRTTMPGGELHQIDFDAGRRRIKLTENVVAGGVASDENKTTSFAYSQDGLLKTLTLANYATGDQITSWKYGTDLDTSDVASSLLVKSKKYPSVGSEWSSYRYNRLSELTGSKDQRGTVHAYDYDALGRIVADGVPEIGGATDGAVRRISLRYEVRGLVESVVSASDAATESGSVLNEVRTEYDPLGLPTAEYQSHHGPVIASTPKVLYQYANEGLNNVRLTQMTYPSGQTLTRRYGIAGSIDDVLDRVVALEDDTSEQIAFVDYRYVGAEDVVIAHYPEPNFGLTYLKQISEPDGEGGDPYSGWDRFQRVIDQRWISRSNGEALERVQFHFDRSGSRVRRLDLVAGPDENESYGYDGLNQIRWLDHGPFDAQNPQHLSFMGWREQISYDPSGNWVAYTKDESGIPTLRESRTHNAQNEIVSIQQAVTSVGYDAAGNMIRCPASRDTTSALELTYDAWNRLVKVAKGGEASAGYEYDGVTRRISEVQEGQGARHSYYSLNWRLLEERGENSVNARKSFVWGVLGLDDLVCRITTDAQGASERVYSMSDSASVTAIADTAGLVRERYRYTAFGTPIVLDAAFGIRATSLFSWETRFCGYRWDENTRLYCVRFRYYHSELGRWLTRDPLNEIAGLNLFAYVFNNPKNYIDETGLHCRDCFAEFMRCNDQAESRWQNNLRQVAEDVRRELASWMKGVVDQYEDLDRYLSDKKALAMDNCVRDYKPGSLRLQFCRLGVHAWYNIAITELNSSYIHAIAVGILAAAAGMAAGALAADLIRIEDKVLCLADRVLCSLTYGEDEQGCPCRLVPFMSGHNLA